VRRGYLKRIKKENRIYLEITPEGRAILEEASTENLVQSRLIKKHQWDRRWRLVIYDIPQSKKKVRDQLRYFLIRTGFIKIQGSVWVFPFECEELIELTKKDLLIGKELLYAVVETIESDRWLRKHFKLPLDG
jgi:DNA-binding transcriptional regulator PaaX